MAAFQMPAQFFDENGVPYYTTTEEGYTLTVHDSTTGAVVYVSENTNVSVNYSWIADFKTVPAGDDEPEVKYRKNWVIRPKVKLLSRTVFRPRTAQSRCQVRRQKRKIAVQALKGNS